MTSKNFSNIINSSEKVSLARNKSGKEGLPCKKTCKFIFFSCIALLLIMQFMLSTSALIQFDGVSVTRVTQAKSAWCWAACSEMMGKAMYNSSPSTQYDVAFWLKGTESEYYPNVGGTLNDTADGSDIISEYSYYFITDSILSYSDLVAEMKSDQPVIAGLHGTLTSHMVVINGTELRDDSSGTSLYVYYIDPWDGTSHICLYSALCDGSYNGYSYTASVRVGGKND